jgi:hypothetical protein
MGATKPGSRCTFFRLRRSRIILLLRPLVKFEGTGHITGDRVTVDHEAEYFSYHKGS